MAQPAQDSWEPPLKLYPAKHLTPAEAATSQTSHAVDPIFLKMDATAQMLVTAHRSGSAEFLQAVAAHGTAVVTTEAMGDESVEVLILLASPDAAWLDGTGVQRHVQVGNTVAVTVPLEALGALAARPEVHFIEIGGRSEPQIDRARADVRADLVHSGEDLPRAYQGEGVVVGVVDTGVDFTHPDFRDEDGSRILYLWDMPDFTNANPPTDANPTFTWGTEYTKHDIDTNPDQIKQRDGDLVTAGASAKGGDGHGTHVLSANAGGGNGGVKDPGKTGESSSTAVLTSGSSFTGIAPKADIIFATATNTGGFSNRNILAGVDSVFRRAEALGKPAVVNLSIGDLVGPRDGSTLFEEGLRDLAGEGRIIVMSAGNFGGVPIHAAVDVDVDLLYELVVFPYPGSPPFNFLTDIDIWYEPGAVRSVAAGLYELQENGTYKFVGRTPFVDVGTLLNADIDLGDTNAKAIISATTKQDFRNGDGHITVTVSKLEPPEHIWSILFYGAAPGRVDAWVREGDFATLEQFDLLGPDESSGETQPVPGDMEMTMSGIATAERVITVGAYTTRTSWFDMAGGFNRYANDAIQGELSWFSSWGPTRDGRLAPTIAAPGEVIAAARSSHVTIKPKQADVDLLGGIHTGRVLPGGQYSLLQGTSMSSPIVAGVVALMLEVDPTLDYDQVVEILTSTARSDAQTGTVPNSRFGSGRLDAYRAVQKTLEQVGTLSTASANPEQIELTLQTGTESATTFELRNEGDDSLVYAIRASLYADAGLQDGLATVSATPNQGTLRPDSSVTITIGLKAGRLNAGEYEGHVTVAGDAGMLGVPLRAFVRTSVDVEDDGEIPTTFALDQNYPNPFNPETTIRYALPQAQHVTLRLYDVLGRQVRTLVDAHQALGRHAIAFQAHDLSSGVYLYRLTAGAFTDVKVLTVAK